MPRNTLTGIEFSLNCTPLSTVAIPSYRNRPVWCAKESYVQYYQYCQAVKNWLKTGTVTFSQISELRRM